MIKSKGKKVDSCQGFHKQHGDRTRDNEYKLTEINIKEILFLCKKNLSICEVCKAMEQAVQRSLGVFLD